MTLFKIWLIMCVVTFVLWFVIFPLITWQADRVSAYKNEEYVCVDNGYFGETTTTTFIGIPLNLFSIEEWKKADNSAKLAASMLNTLRINKKINITLE